MNRHRLLLLLWLAGCGSSRPPVAPPAPTPPASALSHEEIACADARSSVQARRYELTVSADRRPIDSFARLTAEERARLTALQAQPDLRLTLHLQGSRLALSLPASHPLGPVELLIADELELAALHFPDRSQRMTVPRDQLPDRIDGAERSSLRSGYELELAPIPAEELLPGELPASGVKLRAVGAQVRFRYYPTQDQSRSWPVRLGLRLLVKDEIVPPAGALPGPGLLAALPLLGHGEGLTLLAAITEQVGRPARFTVETVNESKPAGATPWLAVASSDLGWVRVPRSSFCFHRPGYRDLRAARQARPGLQLIPPAVLAGLRAARAGGVLEVRNRSGYAALIYLDGALLGFVSAGERMLFRGIPEGYYRIYARSPTGIRAFGPFDHYVPGPLTLR